MMLAAATFSLFPDSATAHDLGSWRLRLLDRLLSVVTLAGWIVAVPSVALAVVEGLWSLVAADLIALLWVTWLWRRSEVPYPQRVLHFLTLMYLLSVVLLINVGHPAQIFLMAVPVFAVLFVSLRFALGLLALNAATLLIGGYWLAPDTALAGNLVPPYLRWAVITFNFLLINGALTASCAFLLTGLERVLSAQRDHARQLAHQATHDALTGLANRTLLFERIEQATVRARRGQHMVAVLLLDLDRFKYINDSLGHGQGDELVAEVARRLAAAVRMEDTVARLGGDEFVVLLTHPLDEGGLALAAARIHESTSGLYVLGEQELHITCSVGIGVYPRDGENASTLLRNADTAMYRAKEGGRNRVQFYRADMNARLAQRLKLENELRRALERDELLLYYQPKCAAHSATIRGAEALLRWRHPELGLVSPAQFIPIAEETGLIVPIGDWILRQAAADAARWQSEGLPLHVAVNISPRQFRHKDLPAAIDAALATPGLSPGSLEVEITEGMLMHDIETTRELLHALRGRGVRIALDDFGTGFSSLSYLKGFPLDVLKVDQSFVRGLEQDPRDRAIVRTVVELAQNLGLRTVAEGVETEGQQTILRAMGVDALQGYLLARPMPAAEFGPWLRARAAAETPPGES